MDNLFDLLPPSLKEALGTPRELTDEERLRYKKMFEVEERKANLPEPEMTKAKRAEPTSEVTSEINDLDKAAMEYFREALLTGNDSKMQAFKAGAYWQKQQLIKQSLEAVREEFPDGTFIYSTKSLIDDDMEERGICLFDYLNVRIVLIQSV